MVNKRSVKKGRVNVSDGREGEKWVQVWLFWMSEDRFVMLMEWKLKLVKGGEGGELVL